MTRLEAMRGLQLGECTIVVVSTGLKGERGWLGVVQAPRASACTALV